MTQLELSFQPFYDDIRRYAARIMGNWYDADDVVQETFYRYFKSEYACPEHQQRSCLYRIARNFMIDSFRKRKHFTQTTDDQGNVLLPTLADPSAIDPSLTVQQRDSFQRLERQILQKPPRVQEILRLRYNEDMKTKDIAFVLGMGHANVRKILSQTIAQLSEQMGDGES